MRNLAAKVPEDVWPEVKARIQAAYQAPSRAIARDLAKGVIEDFEKELPSAMACFEDDFEACIAHLRMPVTHRRAIRTTDEIDKPEWRWRAARRRDLRRVWRRLAASHGRHRFVQPMAQAGSGTPLDRLPTPRAAVSTVRLRGRSCQRLTACS
jgi:hypothetical protein